MRCQSVPDQAKAKIKNTDRSQLHRNLSPRSPSRLRKGEVKMTSNPRRQSREKSDPLASEEWIG
jgi:hypothetical protein